MSLSFNKLTSPEQIGDIVFWFDYFNSDTVEGNSGAGFFKEITDTQSGYILKPPTPTNAEEFGDNSDGYIVRVGSNMRCIDETSAEFEFLHKTSNTVFMRVKHADFSTGGNTVYLATGRGNEQSYNMNYEQSQERRRIYSYSGGVGTTLVERPYQNSKYPVSITEDVFFNIGSIIDYTAGELVLINNGIKTFTTSIGAAGTGGPRFPLGVGGTDIGTSGHEYVVSQLIAFSKVLTDSQIQQLNSFFNTYTG